MAHSRSRRPRHPGRVARGLRYLCWWRNPLQRRSDRLESVSAVLLLLLVVGAMPLAIVLSRSQYGRDMDHAAMTRSQIYRTTAVLTRNAPGISGSAGVAIANSPRIAARWRDRNGHLHHGMVTAAYGNTAGTPVPVWLDRAGSPTTEPEPGPTLKANAIAEGISIVLLVAMGSEFLRRSIKWRLDKQRLQDWDGEWDHIGPQWSRKQF